MVLLSSGPNNVGNLSTDQGIYVSKAHRILTFGGRCTRLEVKVWCSCVKTVLRHSQSKVYYWYDAGGKIVDFVRRNKFFTFTTPYYYYYLWNRLVKVDVEYHLQLAVCLLRTLASSCGRYSVHSHIDDRTG